jgi:UDPglucose--hexose-1-phosphate uridylyltransferase
MPEIRKDPLFGNSVIIAANRDGRPDEFERTAPPRVGGSCPFCLGNEHESPAEIARYTNGRLNGNSSWGVRVVLNKYPAVQYDIQESVQEVDTPHRCPAFGRHEVIVESARHKTSFGDLTQGEARLACLAYRDRIRAARKTDGVKFAHVFKNSGAAAGASFEHVHSQLIALPMIPTRVTHLVDTANRLFLREGKAFLTELIEWELEGGQRIVEQTENLVAFCPFAARFPFETRILPTGTASDFEEADVTLLHEFAGLLHRTVRRIELVTDRAAYNFSLNVRPFDEPALPGFAWNVELFPRLSTPAGFELATGWFINPLAPERAAEFLRSTQIINNEAAADEISSGITH